jgi:hypothetical protein
LIEKAEFDFIYGSPEQFVGDLKWHSVLLQSALFSMKAIVVDEAHTVGVEPSLLAKGYDPLFSSSPLASLDEFLRSHSDGLYVMQLVVAATNQNGLYRKSRAQSPAGF